MRTLAALAIAALCLPACAHREAVNDGLGFEGRQAELAGLADWDIRGGIVVDTGEEAYQSRFRWDQRGNALELDIRGRLGIGSIRIHGDAANLIIESRGETEVLTDPEPQLSARLGWWLPITSAQHWLLGRPDPAYPAAPTRGRFDTIERMRQREWDILYREYQLTDGRLIPRRINLTHESLELTVTILGWEPVADTP